MQILQRGNLRSLLEHGADASRGRIAGGKRSDTRNVVANRSAANRFLVVEGFAPERRVDDQIDFSRFHQINDVRSPFVYLKNGLRFNSCAEKRGRGSPCSNELEAEGFKFLAKPDNVPFVAVVYADKHRTFAWQTL